MGRLGLVLAVATGLLASCKAVCACSFPPAEIVYGRVESASGAGIPTAVVLYRLAIDTACAFDSIPSGELDVGAGGKFRGEIYAAGEPAHCLELSAFDPAIGKPDTASALILTNFADSDSIGVVLRLP